jgi:dTDP-4-dehydrorhamnose 3,5-epimerase
MKIIETNLDGVKIVEQERLADERGYFSRVFCEKEFTEYGMKPVVAQASTSYNARRGTLRGLHFQYPPAAESKYVRCVRGAMVDVVVDLRPESPTYLQHLSVELNDENGRGLYVPERFAHGFITLRDETEIAYMIGNQYEPSLGGGLRYDDPRLAIAWPIPVTVISERDRKLPSISETEECVARLMGWRTSPAKLTTVN